MAIDHSSTEEPRPADTGKKPYEKPSFRHERVFVVSALGCGKVTITQGSCAGNLKLS